MPDVYTLRCTVSDEAMAQADMKQRPRGGVPVRAHCECNTHPTNKPSCRGGLIRWHRAAEASPVSKQRRE